MKLFATFIILGLSLGLSACSRTPAPTQTVAELVATDPQFLALADALEFAELTTTLSGAGPFTVFAPSNKAFELADVRPEILKDIVLYHVIAQKLEAEDLTSQAPNTLTTQQGTSLAYAVEDGNVVLTDAQGKKATVTSEDIQATNGVIHVIDAVLLLPAPAALR
jgi:transforming growth factor-beta-induced protein